MTGENNIRVLVCGGREFTDRPRLTEELDRLRNDRGIALVIAGGARGADAMAEWWAKAVGVPCDVYQADWAGLGRKAGPIRNQRMLDEGKPDLVVAFPGGRGAAEALLRAAAIVIECELPLTREHADAISNLTGESIEIESYSDAGHAVRRWFATMNEATWMAKH